MQRQPRRAAVAGMCPGTEHSVCQRKKPGDFHPIGPTASAARRPGSGLAVGDQRWASVRQHKRILCYHDYGVLSPIGPPHPSIPVQGGVAKNKDGQTEGKAAEQKWQPRIIKKECITDPRQLQRNVKHRSEASKESSTEVNSEVVCVNRGVELKGLLRISPYTDWLTVLNTTQVVSVYCLGESQSVKKHKHNFLSQAWANYRPGAICSHFGFWSGPSYLKNSNK